MSAWIVYRCYSEVNFETDKVKNKEWYLSRLPEKLYDIEHPRIVKRLDECNLCHEGEMGYWISKKWLKGEWTCVLGSPHPNSFYRLEAEQASDACIFRARPSTQFFWISLPCHLRTRWFIYEYHQSSKDIIWGTSCLLIVRQTLTWTLPPGSRFT